MSRTHKVGPIANGRSIPGRPSCFAEEFDHLRDGQPSVGQQILLRVDVVTVEVYSFRIFGVSGDVDVELPRLEVRFRLEWATEPGDVLVISDRRVPGSSSEPASPATRNSVNSPRKTSSYALSRAGHLR